MDDELGHSGLQVPQRVQIELCPFFRWDIWFNRDGVVQNDIARTEARLQVRVLREPISGNENRQLVFVRHAQHDIEQFFAIHNEPILMRVEICHVSRSQAGLHPFAAVIEHEAGIEVVLGSMICVAVLQKRRVGDSADLGDVVHGRNRKAVQLDRID